MVSILLKNKFPLYPVVKAERKGDKFMFSTLVRKKYGDTYYLIPLKQVGESEARAIHSLHTEVHRYLMLGSLCPEDVEDEEQSSEVKRLNLNK